MKIEDYMQLAIKEAKKADLKDEVPVGAVIIKDGKVIAKAHNKRAATNNPFYHAEMIAITKASKKLNDWRLNDCELYVTLEPCLMCLGAIMETRIKRVIVGASNEKYQNINKFIIKEKKLDLVYGILNDECSHLIKNFFMNKRC